MSGSNAWRIEAIAVIHAKWALRNPWFYIYLSVFLPVAILLPFFLLAGPDRSYFVARGTITFVIALNTITSVASDVSNGRSRKAIGVFVVRPVRPLEYMLGISLANLLITLPATVVVVGLTVALTGASIASYSWLIAALALGWYGSAILGFALGLLGPHAERNNVVIVNLVAFLHALLAPVYYPTSSLPDWLRPFTDLLFTTHVARILDAAMGQSSQAVETLQFAVIALVVYTVAMTLLVVWRTRLKNLN